MRVSAASLVRPQLLAASTDAEPLCMEKTGFAFENAFREAASVYAFLPLKITRVA